MGMQGILYHAKTDDIGIKVLPIFLDHESDPDAEKYVWAYHIRIENDGRDTVQLLNRHWKITDAFGHTQEVKGPGVIGVQPIIGPGKSHEYVSGVPLHTPSGIMTGSYQMENDKGEAFDVEIPAFSLDSPYQVVQLN